MRNFTESSISSHVTHRAQNPAAVVAVAVVLGVVGASAFNIIPLLAEGAVHTLGFSGRQIGVMSMAISVGSGASSLFAGVWVRSVQWPRAAMLALGGMVVCNSLAVLIHRYWTFVFLQGLAGFFGGSVLSLAFTILSDRQDSARNFGMANAAQVGYQAAGLLAGPTLLRVAGLDGVLTMLAALAGLAMFLAPRLPARGRTIAGLGTPGGLWNPATLIALVGVGTFFVNAGAYWTYIELMGQGRGISSRVVAGCIAGGVSAGIFGGVFAWWLGERFGILRPLSVAALLTLGSALLLNGSFGVGAFLLSSLLYYFAWNYSVAYQLALINAVDATGRGVAITGAFGYLGAASGAALAALLVTPGDYSVIVWLVVFAVCLSTALFAASFVVHRYGTGSLNGMSSKLK